LIKTLTLAAAAALVVTSASARDQIRIVGSSTVFPFSTAVAEQFGKTSGFKSPIVESTGSGGGLKLFCAGIGVGHPDITNASRKIKKSEVERCAKNGITAIEYEIGYDGIVVANDKSAQQYNFQMKHLFLALAAEVPVDGKLVPNPYVNWSDVDPSLPNVKIEVLGPPPTSGTRDAFLELAMEGGAKQIPELKALRKEDKKKFKKIAHHIREDGAYIDAGENDNLIVQKLQANPNALGVFGFSFLDQNSDVLQGSIVDGFEPTFENIADGKYNISRSLQYYVKKQHIGTIPGIEEYVALFQRMQAEGGQLEDKGLIPLK
jgi:phosphate transport system substrate-binding protein